MSRIDLGVDGYLMRRGEFLWSTQRYDPCGYPVVAEFPQDSTTRFAGRDLFGLRGM